DGVDDWVVRDLSGLRLQHRNSVIKVLIRSWPAAINARQQRSASWQSDSRRKSDQRDKVAPIQWQGFNFRLRHVVAHRPARRLKQRSLPDHIDGLRPLPDLKLNVQPDLV